MQKVQKTVPQIQFIDKFADAPVNVQAEGQEGENFICQPNGPSS